jgi:hypothetical protein
MRAIVILMLVVGVAGCTGPVSPAQRAEALTDIPNRLHPPGTLASAPPADSSFSPLRCWNDGPNVYCNRQDR